MKAWFVAILAIALTACASGAPPLTNITRVVSTTSFGFCSHNCTSRLEISEGQAVFMLGSQRFSLPLSPSEWRDIQRLAASADFDALPDVVGCPDCEDGGAEELAIERAGRLEIVSFELDANLPPAQPLLDRVRAVRARFTPLVER